MAQSHVLFALKRKYGLTLGQLRAAPVDRVRIMGDLGALARVIRLFEPECDVAAIAPIRVWSNRRGRNAPQWTRLALEVLRQANRPMGSREIARRITTQLGIKDPRTLYSIECSLQVTLDRRAAEGDLRAETAPKRWSVV
jgi:hypothetical protein